MNKLLIAAILLVPVMSVVVFAQACDPVKCSSQSRLAGSPFCRNDNLYSAFVDYFCSSNECVSQVGEKLIEQCVSGCSGMSCVTCNQTACEAKSGFYGGRFCRANDIRSVYRQYSCTFREGCTFQESERTVEACRDSTCTDGKCGLCDPSVCNSQDGFYEDEFCSGNNIYRPFRDYSCNLDRCIFARKEIKTADCAYGCDSGKCTVTICDAGCETRNGFAGQPYCKGNDAYRKFRTHFCAFNSCEFNETERKLESCSGRCADGFCTGLPLVAKEKFIEFDLNLSAVAENVRVSRPPERLYNGLIFGRNDIAINVNGFVELLGFEVIGTNKLGKLQVFLDDANLRNVTEKGTYIILINSTAKVVRMSTTSSGLVFWTPAIYDLGRIELKAIQAKIRDNRFSFVLGPEYAKFKSGEIDVPESVTVLINGGKIGKEFGKSSLRLDENEIVFESAKPITAKAKLRIEYVE